MGEAWTISQIKSYAKIIGSGITSYYLNYEWDEILRKARKARGWALMEKNIVGDIKMNFNIDGIRLTIILMNKFNENGYPYS